MRDANGRFVKGNKCGKKDINKEMAQHWTAMSLYRTADYLCNKTKDELVELLQQHQDELPVYELTLLNEILKGRAKLKALQWFTEMLISRPRQEIEHAAEGGLSLVYNMKEDKKK